MKRAKVIGYTHASLTTAWIILALTDRTSAFINSVLGDSICVLISWTLMLPFAWIISAQALGRTFTPLAEGIAWVVAQAILIILNSMFVGYSIDFIIKKVKKTASE